MSHPENKIELPEYPKTKVVDSAVIIEEDENFKYLWGYEKNEVEAKKVAEQIEIELKVIKLVKSEVLNHVDIIRDTLDKLFISTNLLDDLIIEGFSSAITILIKRKSKEISKYINTP